MNIRNTWGRSWSCVHVRYTDACAVNVFYLGIYDMICAPSLQISTSNLVEQCLIETVLLRQEWTSKVVISVPLWSPVNSHVDHMYLHGGMLHGCLSIQSHDFTTLLFVFCFTGVWCVGIAWNRFWKYQEKPIQCFNTLYIRFIITINFV